METTSTSPKKKMTIGQKILIVVGILVLIGIIGSQLDKNKEANASLKSDATTANLTQAQKDSIAKVELEEIKKNTITARQLITEYVANEVNADNNFKGKTFYVSGTITDIKKDILKHIYVTLDGGDVIRRVQCFFEDAETAAKLSKGMNVTFMGKCEGLMMNVLMKDCKLISAN